MAYGVVLRPDPQTARDLIALSQSIGAAHTPLMLLGEKSPPHVSVLHVDADPGDMPAVVRSHQGRTFDVKPIGLLFAVVPPGDYYVPTGGHYFGIEVIRTPELNALHHRFLELGQPPLGLVGDDYRPHITLGMTAEQPTLPPLDRVPAATLKMTLASGPVAPFGTFPHLT
ncbi:2'-5' RNA ligase family protein [Actinoplanes sp. NPDC023714]|uniref:2'-5' RNA ligase family protein n=1 Tax=Actinoplanes sp. NPDC023714 TaxID=3154322 RepID=UPI0033F789B7